MRKNSLLISTAIFSILIFSNCKTKTYLAGYEDKKYGRVEEKTGIIIYDFNSYDLDVNFSYYYSDTLRISYMLWSSSSEQKFSIKIENLQNFPLYIDLSQSSFIKNGFSQPYRSYVNDMSTNFIPPKSYYILEITPKLDITVADYSDLFREIKKSKQLSYVESNTPFIFRNILTFSTQKNLETTKMIDNKFWVSNIQCDNNIEIEKNILDKKNKAYQYYKYNETVVYTQKEPVYKTKKVADGWAITYGCATIIGVWTLLALLFP